MSIETAIFNILSGDSDVKTLVANSDSPVTYRIRPLVLPQGYDLPAITYQRISTERLHDLSGPTGRAIPRFQIDCWADTYIAVRDLSSKVRIAMDGKKGTLGSEANVGGIYLEGEREIFDEETEAYRVILDFFMPHEE